jgi:hypothetical protein
MCTTISNTDAVSGSGKGRDGWFTIDHAVVGYDHPAHVDLEHAVSIDFVDSNGGPGARVAVELSRESARMLAERLLGTVAEADAYEAR